MLGRWVLERSCQEATSWPRGVSVSVNVSAVQLRDRDLAVQMRDALAGAGLDPSRLTIEIVGLARAGATTW